MIARPVDAERTRLLDAPDLELIVLHDHVERTFHWAHAAPSASPRSLRAQARLEQHLASSQLVYTDLRSEFQVCASITRLHRIARMLRRLNRTLTAYATGYVVHGSPCLYQLCTDQLPPDRSVCAYCYALYESRVAI